MTWSAVLLVSGFIRWKGCPVRLHVRVGPGITPAPTRVAWCYGDLGIAVALFLAARCVNESSWQNEALALARNVAGRPPEQSGVKDCGLCHGAAGVGHLFNRLFQAT